MFHQPLPGKISGRNAVPTLRQMAPNVFLIFAKNMNGNVLLMEAIHRPGKNLGCDVYWVDLQTTRKRSPFIIFDRLAYGHTWKATGEHTGELTMNRFNRKIRVEHKQTPEGLWITRGYCDINNTECFAEHIWIEANGSVLNPIGVKVTLVGRDRMGNVHRERLN